MIGCILSIETSTPRGSVAVVREDGGVVYEQSFSSERSHNSQLFAPLREALDVCGAHLRSIVVGTGPASYTGVRIGIAAAQGIAMSRGVPLIGLASVLAPDLGNAEVSSFVVCGDGRRGIFFVAVVRDGKLAEPLCLTDAAGLRERHASGMSGAGQAAWYTFDIRPPLELPGVLCVSPSAARLGGIAAKLPDAEKASLAALPLEPVYLAAPFITQPKGKAG